MKDVLDLLEEFCRLDDAKTRSRGRLPPLSESRWRDLKSLYDRLMSRETRKINPTTPQFEPDDIRQRIKNRKRLRIRTNMDGFFRYEGNVLPSRLVNLSRGGLFLGSNVLLEKGSLITVYLPNLGGDYGELFETQAEVVWATRGIPESGLPRGMGVRFHEIGRIAAEQLDSFIIESLQKQLEK